MLGDTGDAGGVSMAAGKSFPLVRVALSLVTSVVAGLAPAAPAAEAAAGGLRADSAVCVLQSRVGGLADDGGALVASALVAGAGLLPTLLLLLAARPGAAPRTMSDNLLLAVVAEVAVVGAEEPSSAVAPWLNDSSSRKPGKGGKAASSRSNFGASAPSLDLLPSVLPTSALEPFSSFFLRLIRLSWYFCEGPEESLPASPLGLPLE